ncbi:unnamed protein product [Caenorhabditis sp. 36 PRJEB53466]|nr:unnamed protein product [Caenorhabditis sp. 36 PRJEB53466]
MSSEVLKAIDPRGYFAAFFKEGIYPDGRGLLDEQKLVFKQGECGGVGSSVVSTQGVTVSCSIQASVSLASDADLIDVRIEPNQQINEKDAEEYNSVLGTLFAKQFFVKRENLRCRDASDRPLPLEWQLHVSVNVLSVEGNVLDAVVCSIVAALSDTRLPSIQLNHSTEDESAIEKSQMKVDGRTAHRLRLEPPLFSSTFGIFAADDGKGTELLILTPSTEAMQVCRATCSVVVGADDQMVLVRQRGRVATFSLLKKMCQIAAERRLKFVESLQKVS